ncbi:MAG: beta-ribofuranosylaminobenzene 5'-phosphate synthase family protein [Jatrophihabitantaceae bacterium]
MTEADPPTSALPSTDGWAVRVTAPARLSFTLISLDASSMRRNGIAAMAVDKPSVTVEVRVIDGADCEIIGAAEETAVDLAHAMKLLQQQWSGPPARVEVLQSLPEHSGFGSKTTTLLAVGYAYALLCGRKPDLRGLAELLNRGRTSGASTGLAEFGGFLVDGGHRNKSEFRSAPRSYLLPSRFAQPAPPPVPVIRLDFPAWPVLVLVTPGRHLGGTAELDWFRSVTPIPPEESWRTSHLVLMGLAPAVAEADYEAFCAALNEITFTSYFKRAQIAVQGPGLTTLLETARDSSVIDAIGLSVTGPACFAFSREPARAARWAEQLRSGGQLESYWFTNANNRGLNVSLVP